MEFESIHRVYFLGIGGIGMSALARYFHSQGKVIAGYDLSSSSITESLKELDIQIHFEDNPELIPGEFLDKETTLIIFTPAIPDNHLELNYLRENGFKLTKRAAVLGQIFNNNKGIAVAGTHGKTSVTTYTSFLLQESGIGCSAFLGGISKNYNSNLVLSSSDYVVAEADEFDRSFLQLYPDLLLITTIDADHLDIYKNLDDIRSTFLELVGQVSKGGTVILNEKAKLELPSHLKKRTYSYCNPDTDYYGLNHVFSSEGCVFDLQTPQGVISALQLKIPGKTNVENAIAAIALSIEAGASLEALKVILPGMKGIVRRFDVQVANNDIVYIDDYAHHPRELDALITSVRSIYPEKKLTLIFQPHLFSRTRDFADEFAKSLSNVDELILLDIYPAREEPMPGITSEIIIRNVTINRKQICSKVNLLSIIKELNIEVLVTAGAGDIDKFVKPIKQMMA